MGLVFFDTTSIYFEGRGGESIGRHGHSKDHRPDLAQMIVGIALDVEGRPICCEMRPGNTTDVRRLVPVVERMWSNEYGRSSGCAKCAWWPTGAS